MTAQMVRSTKNSCHIGHKFCFQIRCSLITAIWMIPMKKKNMFYFINPGSGARRTIPVSAPLKTVVACDSNGFTLVELIVVMAIIGILASIAMSFVPSVKNVVGTSKCQAEIRVIEKDIAAYMVDKGEPPASLNVIGRAGLLDPWGRPYLYQSFANGAGTPRQDSMLQNYNSDFDLYSQGSDGASAQDFDDPASKDDIIRSGNGSYVGKRSF